VAQQRRQQARWRRLVVVSVFLALPLLAAGLVWSTWLVPNRRLGDPEWLAAASAVELRETAHQVLFWPVGNHHDACLYLQRVGDASSAPAIRRALQWTDDSGPERIASCTHQHCLDAIRILADGDQRAGDGEGAQAACRGLGGGRGGD